MRTELKVDNEPKIRTRIYVEEGDNLFSRKERSEERLINPVFLTDDNAVILGEHTCRHPFKLKGLIGQSGMSYGALGENAITALSKGLAMAGGTWMNTGEGGLSQYHLAGKTDIIFQIGPGLFGVRNLNGEFSWEAFKKKVKWNR